MNRIMLAAAAAALLVGACTRAEAMMPVSPSLLGIAAAHRADVDQVTNVCGSNGCVAVQTRRVQKHNLIKNKINTTFNNARN